MIKDLPNVFNLIFGILLFIAFLITGYYMNAFFKPEHLNDFEQRLQIRSNHIYILFIALLNITLSMCRNKKVNKLISYLDLSARAVIALAGIVALFAFCFEHTGEISDRTLTLIAVILSLTSIGLLLLTKIVNK